MMRDSFPLSAMTKKNVPIVVTASPVHVSPINGIRLALGPGDCNSIRMAGSVRQSD